MLNQAQIIGHLGRDPEVRYTSNGAAICNFSLATTEKWKDKATGEAREQTEWHRITAFDKLAEIMGQYLRKGSLVYISGKLKTRKWTDKDGVEKFTTEISASEMKMLGGRQERDDDGGGTTTRTQPPQRQQAAPQRQQAGSRPDTGTGFDDMDDDIPF